MEPCDCSGTHPHSHSIFPIFCIVSARSAVDLESLRNHTNSLRFVIEENECLRKHCSGAATSHGPIGDLVCRIHSGTNYTGISARSARKSVCLPTRLMMKKPI